MKRIASIFLFSFIHLVNYAQNVNFVWAKQMGGVGSGGGGWSIATDAAGNVYTTGEFAGTVDFDPGPAVFNLISASNDIFVSKSDPAGNLIWAKQMGGADYDASLSIALDASGNVYTTGFFSGTADFDPGSGLYNLSTDRDYEIFICKLDAAGNFIWARQMVNSGPLNCSSQSFSIAIDTFGNVYTTGGFAGTVDFDPGPGVFKLSSAEGSIYISKLDAAGNFVWAKQMQDFGYSWGGNTGYSIAVDASGNVYTTGGFYNTVDFDPGPGIFNLSTGSGFNGDIFVSKLDAFGNFIWAKQMHGIGYTLQGNFGMSIAVDISGSVYTTGYFLLTTDFDPGSGVFNLITGGSGPEIYISKLDPAGNFIWARQMKGSDGSLGVSIALDATGNIYTTGYFDGIVDFDPGTAVFSLSSSGEDDIFISKLDAAGNFVWAKQMGSGGPDVARSIKLDPAGNIYTTGSFQGSVDFDPGNGIYNLTSGGLSDIFIHKMSQCTNSTFSTITIVDCKNYTLNNQTYTATGVYTQTLSNAAGCDSIITLNLTINRISTVINEITCASYTWNNQTYSTSGIYTDTLVTANGCDSIIKLNLTINKITAVINAATCKNYTWNNHTYTTSGIYTDTLITTNGCDSIITLNLTINKITDVINAAACKNYTWNNHAYTTSGTYIDTLITANGCDSIVTLNLTITPKLFSTIAQSICAGQTYLGYSSSGTYIDTLVAANGCDSIRSLQLTVLSEPAPDLGTDKEICSGDSVILYPGLFTTYNWQNGSNESHLVAKQPGLYSVVVTDNCGTARDEILITEDACNIYFPSAFTPNNDGRNDWFKILGGYNLKEYHLAVYNRWGQKVFETFDMAKGWNGSFNGQSQPTATFVWYCEFNKPGNTNKTKMKGAVTLIR